MDQIEKIKGLALAVRVSERVALYLEDGRQIWISLGRIYNNDKVNIVIDAPKTITILREKLTMEPDKCLTI